ncbi:MAG: flavodoxin [Clostridiales bacterium]|nr:flavodoxin [Clostridiales bacterium]
MSKIAIVYWSGTGNTESMADAVESGAKEAGSEVSRFTASQFNPEQVSEYDAIAFGCPAMGAEVLEESEFDPMFTELENSGVLSGKKVGLFGSYGWGDGEWMRNWEERCKNAGAALVCEGVICNESPDDEANANCRKLGADLSI